MIVLDGYPVNLKGQHFKDVESSDYVQTIGSLPQVELLEGTGADTVAPGVWAAAGFGSDPHEFSSNNPNASSKAAEDQATWVTEEKKVQPRFVRGRSGGYTYYCVTTSLNNMDAASIQARLMSVRPPNGVWTDTKKLVNAPDVFTGAQAPATTKTLAINQILDNLSLQKRVLWLHGVATANDTVPSSSGTGGNLRPVTENGTADSRNMHTMPTTTSSLLSGIIPRMSTTSTRYGEHQVQVSTDTTSSTSRWPTACPLSWKWSSRMDRSSQSR